MKTKYQTERQIISMTEWAGKLQNDIIEFEIWWLGNGVLNPRDFPDEMWFGDWEEQFSDFCEQQDKRRETERERRRAEAERLKDEKAM